MAEAFPHSLDGTMQLDSGLTRTAGHKNAVVELHWMADESQLISASSDKSVRAWDAVTGNQIKKMAEHDNFVNSCCPLTRGPPLVVSGSDDGTAKVRCRSARASQQVLTGMRPRASLCCAGLGPASEAVSADLTGEVPSLRSCLLRCWRSGEP